ncbi:MAG: hypothetical protein OQK50_07180, partial [Deltaproteobacteria bacterium]|nr:hypothetical protein [Deltaproteobacteria bacterium]
GPLEFVVPAAGFELEEIPTESAEEKTSPSEPEHSEEPPPSAATPAVEAGAEAREEPTSETTNAAAPVPAKPAFADAKKLIDVVFNSTIAQASEEVGALLGQTLKCDDIQLVMTSKADFFTSHCVEKSVLTQLKVTGDKEGLGFMLVQVPDAVVLGGTLIMLPEDQIAEQKNAGEFDGEIADSFGEIANILSGSLTQVFQDRYPKSLRFIKTEAETVVPTTIDPAAAEPFPEGSYFLASFAIHLKDHELNRIQFIFPAAVFDLDGETTADPGQTKTAETTTQEDTEIAPANVDIADGAAPGDWGGPPLADESTTSATAPPIVLLINDQESTTEPFTEILSAAGYDCRTLSFQDEVKDLFQQHQILGIFLVMTQVGEKGFAAAIKLQAAGRPLPPIIFAGPEWTKSAVLRAVKYGAKDILVMPASGDEIQDKVSLHIKKAS